MTALYIIGGIILFLALVIIFWNPVFKRVVDFIGALCGLIILSPVFLIVTILIKKEDPGPAIFRQQRVGKNKKLYLGNKINTALKVA